MAEATLRSRNRARRQSAIEHTAMRLFAKRGYDETTVVEIAHEAEVSPRTVSLYFPTKSSLALSYSDASARRMIEALQAAADRDSLLDVVERWLLAEVQLDPNGLALNQAMMQANPMLRALRTIHIGEATAAGRSLLADELARDPSDPVVALVGEAVSGVLNALVDRSLESDFEHVVSLGIGILRSTVAAARKAEAG